MAQATLAQTNTTPQASIGDAVYPALQTKSELRKYKDFCIVDAPVHQNWLPIHPSEAVMLALFDGRASQYQIGEVWAYIYNLPLENGLAMADACVKKFGKYLDLRSEPAESPLHHINPKDFIYKISDESVYQKTVADPLSGERFPIPIQLSISVTQQCNFKCEYCYTAPIDMDSSSKESTKQLDLPKVLSLLEEASEFGTIFVLITGGEPTLFKGWMDVILKILELNMIPVLTTNGSVITRQQLETLAAAGMPEITFSLDAASPYLHHKITQTHNTFDRVIAAIQNSVDVGLYTLVKCVLTTSNYGNIPELIDFVVGMGVKEIGITYMEPGDRNSCATKLNPQVKYEDLIALRQIVLQKRQEYKGKCEIWPPKDPKEKHYTGFVPCGGLYNGMSINAKGGVNICDKLISEEDFIYGNTFKQSLKNIWEGEKFHNLRVKTLDSLVIDPICQGCAKLYICRTGCYVKSLIETGNSFNKDPDCGGPY
jgi:radical SAM protein with 4Fe4S-binding SPASM domain